MAKHSSRPRTVRDLKAEAERQNVSLAFIIIDVVDSGRFDADEMDRIKTSLDRILKVSIDGRGGKSGPWEGDGRLGVFLAEGPNACVPAVEAALAIQRECKQHSGIPTMYRSREPQPVVPRFELRVAVHYGPGRANLRDGRLQDTNVHSSELNWMSHREKDHLIGEPGTVVVTDSVCALLSEELRQEFLPKVGRIDGHQLYFLRPTEGVSPQAEIDLIRRVAQDYHVALLDVSEIAAKHQIHGGTVHDCLTKGPETGVVEIRIKSPPAIEREAQLQECFRHLLKAAVVKCADPTHLKEELGKRAAHELQELMRATQFVSKLADTRLSLSVSCGTTVWATVEGWEREPMGIRDLDIHSLLITMSPETDEPSPAGIVNYFTKVVMGSRGHTAQLPKVHEDRIVAMERKQIYEQDCQDILDGARGSAFALTGIGAIGMPGETHSFNALIGRLELRKVLEDMGAVGEICYHPLTVNGEILMDRDELEPLRNNLIYVPLSDLQRKVQQGEGAVFAVAGGPEKRRAVLGALRARAFNYLVTDLDTAQFILENYF